MHLLDLLDRVVADAPDRPALVSPTATGGRRVMTFGELHERTLRLATVLRAAGVGHQRTVLVLHPPTAELYPVLAALVHLGAVAVTVEPPASRRIVEAACAVRPPDVLLAGTRTQLLRLASPVLRRVEPVFVTGQLHLPGARRLSAEGAAPDRWPPSAVPDEPALIVVRRTAGAEPRLTVWTHQALVSQQVPLAAAGAASPGDVDLAGLPVAVLANLATGATSVLPDADVDEAARANPVRILRQIGRERPARLTIPPALLERLVEGIENGGATPESVGAIVAGGGPVFPDLLERTARSVPEAHFVAVYGRADTGPLARLDAVDATPDDRRRMREGAGLLVGLPLPGVEVRILAAELAAPPVPEPALTEAELDARTLPQGEPGAIVVSAAHLADGPWSEPDDLGATTDVNGRLWHRTGDAGYLDERGRLWLVGRVGNAIADRRGTLYPLSAEAAARAALRGRPVGVAGYQGERVLVVEAPAQAVLPKVAALGASLRWAEFDVFARTPRLPLGAGPAAVVHEPSLAALLDEGLDAATPDAGGWLRLPAAD